MLEYNLQFFAEGGDKTEEPTAKKLDDARKEGQVAKSKEIGNCLGLFVFFLVLRFMAGGISNKIVDLFGSVYGSMHTVTVYPSGEMPVRAVDILFRNSLITILTIVAPMMIIGYVVAFVGDLVQVKWKPTGKPLQPKLSKINPIKPVIKFFAF